MSSYDIQLLWYFGALDLDADDLISESEYSTGTTIMIKLADVSFDDADTESDGYITINEFYSVMGGDLD